MVEVFEAAGGGGGGAVEGFGFVVGLAADHPRPDDACQRVRPGHDPFGLTAAGRRGCHRCARGRRRCSSGSLGGSAVGATSL